jgi:hypothetical protein
MIRRLLIIVWVAALVCLCAIWVRSRHVTDTISFLSSSDTDHTVTTDRDDFTFSLHSHATVDPIDADQRKPGWSHTFFTERATETLTPAPIVPIAETDTFTVQYSGSLPIQTHHLLGMQWLSFQVSWPAFKGPQSIVQHWDFVSIPYWTVLVILLLPAVVMIHRAFRRRRRISLNHCIHCGYDLRGGGRRCPECGNVSAVPASAIASPDV